ncbi:hypothetical protein TrRE_jg6838 [Triparma retinervis]|uniref:Uncharacterized protein n=1 Tax=Triparma retinervis TaxID=2557542 RepID=A0A9W7E3D3_9STRA|nr:hypothetical protein TrRE_jg6838 [Triparma retinervis]
MFMKSPPYPSSPPSSSTSSSPKALCSADEVTPPFVLPPFVLPPPTALKRSTRTLSSPLPSSPVCASAAANNAGRTPLSWTTLLLSALRTSTGARTNEDESPDHAIDRRCNAQFETIDDHDDDRGDKPSSKPSSKMPRVVSDLSLNDRAATSPSPSPSSCSVPPMPTDNNDSFEMVPILKTGATALPKAATSPPRSVSFHSLVEVFEFPPHPLIQGVFKENLWWGEADYKEMRQRQRVQEWCKMVLGTPYGEDEEEAGGEGVKMDASGGIDKMDEYDHIV